MHLTLLHFNDLHARLDQLPRLFTLIQRERAAAETSGRRVLLLDAGDSSDRGRWESDVTKGRANFAVLEAMGVDATVVGNGEALQWGRAALARLVQSVSFPVLAANLVDLHDPTQPAVPGLRASVLLAGGLGVIGLTAMYADGYERFGYTAAPPEPSLQREIAALRAQGATAIILLSHLGSDTRFPEQDPRFYHDEDAARAAPELALIIGAHTHDVLYPPVKIGDTLLVQAGDYGKYLGRLDVDLDPATGKVLAFSGHLLPCDETIPPDPTISGTLELVRDEATRLMAQTVGHAARDIPQPEYAILVADALRAECQADLAIIFSGFAFRGLQAGPITRRDLYDSLLPGAHVTAATVTGAQLQRMVERMLAPHYRTDSANPQRGFPPLGLPATSPNLHLTYQLPLTASPTLLLNHAPIVPTASYRLASTYLTLNPITDDPEYDFIGLQPGQVVENIRVEDVLWEIVEDWVKARGTLG